MSGKSGDHITTVAGDGEREVTGNSECGGTATALQKKRVRRVSFAEMTSVRFFDRDEEENETSKEGVPEVKDGDWSAEKDDILGFLQFPDSNGDDGEERRAGEEVESDDEEVGAMRRSFLRPIESPSPGSGFGSATSNDEDFFGPVSASFIRPDRLSDSGVSDDNRDVTMDSTAFSMHFRSLARSDSGVDLKTPTGVHLFFEEKTSTQTNAGSSMELTLPKKLVSISSSPAGKRGGGSNSSDMSLVGDSPSGYDYGRLSPGLDALLADGTKNFGVISDSNNIVALESPKNFGNVFGSPKENLSSFMDDTYGKVVGFLHEESVKANSHADRSHELTSTEFVSSPANQREIFQSGASPLNHMSVLTPQQQRDSYLHKEEVKNYGSASSIQKSISKLKLLEASPFSASLTSKIENLNIKQEVLKSSPFKILLERELNSFQPKHLVASSRATNSQVLVASPKKRAQIADSSTDNNNTRDPVGRELISLTKGSNADWVSTAQLNGGKELTGTNDSLVLCPEKCLQKELTVSQEQQNSDVLVLHDQFVDLQSSGLKEKTIDVNLSTAPYEIFSSFYMGTRVDSGSPVVKLPAFNKYEVSAKDDGGIRVFDKQDDSGSIKNLGTPTRENVSHLTHTKKLDGSSQVGMGISVTTSNLPWGEPESATSSSAVPSVRRYLTESTFQENAVNSLPQSASMKEFEIIGRERIDVHNMVDVSASTPNQLKSPQKRRNEILYLQDSEHRNEVSVQQRNPKLLKIVGNDSLTLRGPNKGHRETVTLAHSLKHWVDIHSKFLEDAERLVPSSMYKLNFSVVDSLEDVSFNLKKSKTYGMLCNEIVPQKTSFLNGLHSKRIGEIRLLMHQMMHEKSKLQLMCAKKKMLLGKFQMLSSAVQETQTLKMNFLPKFMGDTQGGVIALQNFDSIWQRDEDARDKVTAMKQALEALNKKNANFSKALQSSCKMKGVPSSSACILLANDYLGRKSCHRLIRLGMQILVVEDVKSMDNLHDISLNYLDIIIQSFKFTGCPASSIVISNKLDDINIVKNFPNMDVCKAFSFVLNAETTQKYIGSKSLAREVQITSSFLGNLVDVVREVQLARIELQNLLESIFQCPLAGQLNLQLCFFCSRRGKKVSLILDMSCLNRSIYPSEILPSQLTASFAGNDALVDPIIEEITGAVKNLKAGYIRILRLCRCISLVVHGSNSCML